MGDVEHRLPGRPEPFLEPLLPRHIEVVVRLVEQQHLGRGGEESVEDEAFLLAAGEGATWRHRRLCQGEAERLGRAAAQRTSAS